MFDKFLRPYRQFKEFLGDEVWALMIVSICIGFLWFGVESAFVYVLQGILRSLKLLDEKVLFLPSFFPKSFVGAILVFLVFGIVRALVSMLKEYFTGVTNQVFIRVQRSKILDYGINTAHSLSAHDIITIFNDRIAQSGAIISKIAHLTIMITSALLLLVFGFYLAPYELLIGLFLLAIFVLPLKLLNKKINIYGSGLVTESDKVNKTLLLGIRNHFFLKLYGLIPQELKKGNTALRNFEVINSRFFMIAAFKNAFPIFVGTAVISFVTYISLTYFTTSGAKLLSFYYVFIRIAQTLGIVNVTFSGIRLNFEGFKILYSWNEKHMNGYGISNTEQSQINKLKAFPKFTSSLEQEGMSIEAKNINFSYDGENDVLVDQSFKVSKGETIVIQGTSGSGKSTLLTLILGLNNPSKGEVIINNHNVNEIKQLLPNYLAYVGPEPYLIAGTVKDNLSYGCHTNTMLTDENMWSALEKAKIADIVRAFPNKLDENLNEQTQISTGQKQRLSIARAFFREPKLLILDEATANLDSKTELQFIDELKKDSKDLTTIIISHKDSFNNMATHSINLS